MLVIRESQFAALGAVRLADFRKRAVEHLTRHFSKFAGMQAGEALAFVDAGIQKAAKYEISSERNICKMLNLMAVLGPEFDTALPWARETLATKAGPQVRFNRLYAKAERMADQQP